MLYTIFLRAYILAYTCDMYVFSLYSKRYTSQSCPSWAHLLLSLLMVLRQTTWPAAHRARQLEHCAVMSEAAQGLCSVRMNGKEVTEQNLFKYQQQR
jgi:hypothetical protein